jgi:hypothetical protein
MKKILIILMVTFLVACSKSDKSGRTGPIDEPASSSESSSPVDPKSSSSIKEGDFVWPEEIDGTFKLPNNPYSGKIEEFDWRSVVPGFSEPDKYAYGYDRNPEALKSPEKDEVVYISVETGKKASFIPRFKSSKKDAGYSQYKLVNDDDPADEIPLTDGVLTEITNAKLANDGAHLTYSLYGLNKAWVNLDKRIEVLAYEAKYKSFIYVQLDGDGWNADSDEDSFTKTKVDYYFNDVFGQALVYANSTEEPASKYDLDYLIEVDMLHPSDDVFDKMVAKAGSVMNNAPNLFSADGKVNVDSPYLHIVFAINKERKIWKLENCIDDYGDIDLKSCSGFDPESESKMATYHMVSLDGCSDGVGTSPIDVEIRVQPIIGEGGAVHERFYAVKGGKKIDFAPCDILYTDEGYPLVPSISGVLTGTAAVSVGPDKLSLYFENYLPYGSIVVTPRRRGLTAQYTLMHELGHSFGFTDVKSSDLIEPGEKVEVLFSDGRSLYGYDKVYTNTYASSETNVMAWQQPSGRRIRYRNTPIVCTAGTMYYGGLKDDGTFNPEKFWGAVERPVDGGYENQWECVRGECYTEKYSSAQRKNFWESTGACEVNNKPIDDKSKQRLTDYATFYADYIKSREEKIIRLDD